jgi:hypothetical protein
VAFVSILFAWSGLGAAYLGLLALLEESILARLVCGLVLGEVTLLGGLLQDSLVDTLDVDGGGGSDDIAGVYAAQRNAVNLEGTGDEENTLGKVLEDNDTLATETTSEEDDDGTGLEGGADLRGAGSLTGLEFMLARAHGMHVAACRSSLLAASCRVCRWCNAPALSSSSCLCLDMILPCCRICERTFLGTATSSAG